VKADELKSKVIGISDDRIKFSALLMEWRDVSEQLLDFINFNLIVGVFKIGHLDLYSLVNHGFN